jgi:hypothetical protein
MDQISDPVIVLKLLSHQSSFEFGYCKEVGSKIFRGSTKQPFSFPKWSGFTIFNLDLGRREEQVPINWVNNLEKIFPGPILFIPLMPEPSKP